MIWACSCQWPWTSWGDRKYRTAKKTSNSGAWKTTGPGKMSSVYDCFSHCPVVFPVHLLFGQSVSSPAFSAPRTKWTPRPARLAFDNICVNYTSYLWGLLSVLSVWSVCMSVCLSFTLHGLRKVVVFIDARLCRLCRTFGYVAHLSRSKRTASLCSVHIQITTTVYRHL